MIQEKALSVDLEPRCEVMVAEQEHKYDSFATFVVVALCNGGPEYLCFEFNMARSLPFASTMLS